VSYRSRSFRSYSELRWLIPPPPATGACSAAAHGSCEGEAASSHPPDGSGRRRPARDGPRGRHDAPSLQGLACGGFNRRGSGSCRHIIYRKRDLLWLDLRLFDEEVCLFHRLFDAAAGDVEVFRLDLDADEAAAELDAGNA